MFKIISDLFKKKTPTIDSILLYPEGKRYYRESHSIRKTQIDDDVQKIIHRLNKFGYKSFLVGGCVRDILLGKKPKDFDIVTSATPNQIKNIFNNCRIIGRRFKIVHVIFKNKVVEVSTFRSLPEHRLEKHGSDKDYLLKKDNNFGTPKEDAARRDFTINSLYFDLRNESIIDFVGGLEDLKNGILRVIGDPDISFKEDPVRMIRAVKFGILHGLQFDKATQKAIKKNKNEIEKASTSRMLEEYNKIFRTWRTSEIFKGLVDNHLLDVLFSEALENIKKDSKWRENFLETSIGKRLVIADRMLCEREEVNHLIFFTILFSDVVNSVLKQGSKNIVHAIKEAIEPIANRIELPKKDKEKIIKVFASQQRFQAGQSETAKAHVEIFKNKDFFHESFMFFKINALAEGNEKSIQDAFFWEISSTPPKTSKRTFQSKDPRKASLDSENKAKKLSRRPKSKRTSRTFQNGQADTVSGKGRRPKSPSSDSTTGSGEA
jgi:poly(A) polymerase